MSLSRRRFLEGASTLALASSVGAETSVRQDGRVIELRQYTLRGGQRDTLISMFEKSLLEPQNALGAHIVGTFRDLDDADRFVWIREFRDLSARQETLAAFYGGSIWQANRTADLIPHPRHT